MYYTDERAAALTRIFDGNNRQGFLRLDLNENPGALPEEFIREVLSKLEPELLSRYPDMGPFTRELSQYLGCTEDSIFLSNGSAEAIRYIIQAFSSPGGEIAAAAPSYFMFDIYSQMYGRSLKKILYGSEEKMSADKIIGALSEKTQLLILLNPNNPMGDVYSEAEFEAILSACRRLEIRMLVDEAYHYFYPHSFMPYALGGDRVIVTRSFSKFFSLAGCRLGYAAGPEEDIKVLKNLSTPHNVNAFALAFAGELLKREDIRQNLYRDFADGRRFLISSLDSMGYAHTGQAGNFLFIKPRGEAEEIVRRMREEKGILIKAYDNVASCGSCLRVTVGAEKYMQRFLTALYELDC